MAKLHGLFGKATGKKGDAVFSVRNGQQLMSQYNPIVSNPNTDKQIAARSKMKLVSQLSAVFGGVIAMAKDGNLSPRNRFSKINYPLINVADEAAQLNLKAVQLTASQAAMVDFHADRSSGEAIAVELDVDASSLYDEVLYVCAQVTADGVISVVGETSAISAGEGGTFPASLPYSESDVVVYAYGLSFKNKADAVMFGNIEGNTPSMIARLVTSRKLTTANTAFTKTIGLTMASGQNTADSSDTVRFTLAISVVGNGSVTGAGYYTEGTVVTCVANAGEGATFNGWYRNGERFSVSTSIQITMVGNDSIEARFVGAPVTLAVSSNNNSLGTVSGGQTVTAGTSVTAVATPIGEASFVGWYENNVLVSSDASYTFTLNSNRTLVAHFAAPAQRVVVSCVAVDNFGSVVSGVQFTGEGSYEPNDSVTVVAPADSSAGDFTGWYSALPISVDNRLTTNRTYQFEATESVTLYAMYYSQE